MIFLSMSLMRPGRSASPYAPAIWEIHAGDGEATVVSAPAASGSWLITPGDASAQITAHPEFA